MVHFQSALRDNDVYFYIPDCAEVRVISAGHILPESVNRLPVSALRMCTKKTRLASIVPTQGKRIISICQMRPKNGWLYGGYISCAMLANSCHLVRTTLELHSSHYRESLTVTFRHVVVSVLSFLDLHHRGRSALSPIHGKKLRQAISGTGLRIQRSHGSASLR